MYVSPLQPGASAIRITFSGSRRNVLGTLGVLSLGVASLLGAKGCTRAKPEGPCVVVWGGTVQDVVPQDRWGWHFPRSGVQTYDFAPSILVSRKLEVKGWITTVHYRFNADETYLKSLLDTLKIHPSELKARKPPQRNPYNVRFIDREARHNTGRLHQAVQRHIDQAVLKLVLPPAEATDREGFELPGLELPPGLTVWFSRSPGIH